jgi:DNA-directed RNA polymerase specialized sigma24 family protein
MEQKAVEAAITLVREFGISVEEAAEKMGAPLDKVLEKLNTKAPGR